MKTRGTGLPLLPPVRATSSQAPSAVRATPEGRGPSGARDLQWHASALQPVERLAGYQAADENGVSRIYVGFHFRDAVEKGLRHGRQIGEWAFDQALRPQRGR